MSIKNDRRNICQKNQNINELLEFEARCPDFTTEDMYVSALFWKGKGSKRVQKIWI